MTKLIIFDIGGVIEDFAEEDYINYICRKLSLDRKAFGSELLRMLPSVEDGKATNRELLDRLTSRFGVSAKKLEWAGALKKLAKLNPKMVALFNALSLRYEVVLLTNVSRSRYMQNIDIGLFRKLKFPRVYASCYLRMSKPGTEIYKYVLKKEHVKAEDAVFIDNMAENTEGAEKVGITGVQFVGYDKLVRDLRKIGIKW
jgi:putative hydrolase of the HAD superfamily